MAIYRIQRVFSNDNGNTALAIGAGSLAGAAGAHAVGMRYMNKGIESVSKDLSGAGIQNTFEKGSLFKNPKVTVEGIDLTKKGGFENLSEGALEKLGDSVAKNKGTFFKAGGAGLAKAGLGLAGVGALGYGAYKKIKDSSSTTPGNNLQAN